MSGIKLKAEYRPQLIGNSQKVVSLFSEAEDKKKKIAEDSNGEDSDVDKKLDGQLFNHNFGLKGGSKEPLMIKTDRRRLQ